MGAYEIVAPIGAGGMGEVYRARDPKLGRDVAIKVLPDLFASDGEAVARFEREAKALAQLSHPNILNIFDSGRHPAESRNGRLFAVMELLEGETLRDRLAAGPLTPRTAVEYGVQIAQGLAAAHDKGLVHRDLKPENVFITRDERVKILDFGLAKPLALGSGAATSMQTVGTSAGLVLGTIGYMAPEQVRGQAVDHRSDLFALGTVLYEMLTGRRAFGGSTPADTISEILNTDPPDIDVTPGGVPPVLERIVRRCLEKRPERRFQSARDLAFALEAAGSRSSGPSTAAMLPAPTVRARRWLWPFGAGLGIGIGAALIAAGAWPRSDGGEPRWQQFTPVTDMAGPEATPAVSPDGGTVAFASRARGSWDIYALRVGGRNPIVIAGDPGRHESGPAFSPDGQRIAFHEGDEDGGIFVAGATGESARRLTDFGFHPAWSPDGQQLAFTTEEVITPYIRYSVAALWTVSRNGGPPRKLDDGDAAQAAWSPSGARIAFWAATRGQRDLFTVPAAGGARVAVLEDAPLDWCPVWSPGGHHLYFASDRGGAMNLWRIEIDEASGRALGAPEPVTSGVQAASELPSFSSDGTKLAFRSHIESINPVAIPFDPERRRAGAPVLLSTANRILIPTSVSPDGRLLALSNVGDLREDLFISDAKGSGVRRVTDDPARDRVPYWAPDGQSLVFYSNRDGIFEIWSIRPDGGEVRKVTGMPDGTSLYPSMSPSGDRVVFTDIQRGVYIADVRSGPAATPRHLEGTRNDSGQLIATSWSADGRRLAGFLRAPSGRTVGVAVYDLEAAALKQVGSDRTAMVRWLPDSRQVVFFSDPDGALTVVDTATGRREEIDVNLPLPCNNQLFAVAPDGRTIYCGGTRSEADVWIVAQQ